MPNQQALESRHNAAVAVFFCTDLRAMIPGPRYMLGLPMVRHIP